MVHAESSSPPPPEEAENAAYRHQPVLVDEVLGLVPAGARLLVDGTVGGGGHARALLERFGGAVLFGCDRDPVAVRAAQRRLAPYGERVLLKRVRYGELHHYVLLGTADFVLLDLGVSSHHLDDPARGFSFTRSGPLDMRMDPERTRETAERLVNEGKPEVLTEIFYRLGEERFTPRIVNAILKARGQRRLRTTGELAHLVAEAVPARFHRKGHHPATKVFQALRIAVNDELGELDRFLEHVLAVLAPGGVVAVISFHSLEDRRVKDTFRFWEDPCVCPPHLPRCACGAVALGRRLTRKPVTAGAAEAQANPRSRSAKLRAFAKAGG